MAKRVLAVGRLTPKEKRVLIAPRGAEAWELVQTPPTRQWLTTLSLWTGTEPTTLAKVSPTKET